jgi:hypothetical protein
MDGDGKRKLEGEETKEVEVATRSTLGKEKTIGERHQNERGKK